MKLKADSVIPAPANFASTAESEEASEETELKTKRMPLHQLKQGSKSLSETLTSVDSDSSGRRITEHETSASSNASAAVSPASELNSPQALVHEPFSVGFTYA